MPFSNTEQLSPILTEITSLNPRSILDVGCGLGLYGMLCRIHLDLYYDPEFYRKLDGSQSWNTQIDGIEGCQTYVPFIPRWAYDHVHVGNAMEIVPTMADGQYDLILILAMIEHLTQDQGINLIAQLQRIGRAIILSVPKNWQEQKIEGYPLETHRSHWTEQDLRDIGFTRFLPHKGAWLAVYGIPPHSSSISVTSTNPTPGPFGLSHDEMASLHTEFSRIEHRLGTLNETTEQIRNDIATVLLHQQVIFDRLSISSRLRSLKKRLSRIFPRHLS